MHVLRGSPVGGHDAGLNSPPYDLARRRCRDDHATVSHDGSQCGVGDATVVTTALVRVWLVVDDQTRTAGAICASPVGICR
jgi:hypothetical protein